MRFGQLLKTRNNGQPADRDERVDGLETSLHWLVDGSSRQDTRCLELSLCPLLGVDWALSVDGVAQSVDDSTEKFGSDWNLHDLTGSLDSVAFSDQSIVTEDGDTDVVCLEVEAHSSDTRGEFNHFFGLDISETVDTGDTVTDG